ncbi:hypothetical protein [Rhizobium phage RHph_X2_26]|nr:hypothetical protein [Rhizobium phage RHph_X2_26]
MTQRVRMGPNLGTTGYFLSRAGDDVTSPAQSLLVDSRFPTMNVHQTGRKLLSRFYDSNGDRSLFYGTVTFPDLGYRPLFVHSFIYGNANAEGVPTNTAYYPCSWGSQDTRWMGGDMNGNFQFLESGAWLENNTTLRAKTWIATSSSLSIYLFYIVLKSQEVT